jgi:hypothetical protein
MDMFRVGPMNSDDITVLMYLVAFCLVVCDEENEVSWYLVLPRAGFFFLNHEVLSHHTQFLFNGDKFLFQL